MAVVRASCGRTEAAASAVVSSLNDSSGRASASSLAGTLAFDTSAFLSSVIGALVGAAILPLVMAAERWALSRFRSPSPRPHSRVRTVSASASVRSSPSPSSASHFGGPMGGPTVGPMGLTKAGGGSYNGTTPSPTKKPGSGGLVQGTPTMSSPSGPPLTSPRALFGAHSNP
jgi:hypothetical protein